MSKHHENPQRPAQVFYPPGHPKYQGSQPIAPPKVRDFHVTGERTPEKQPTENAAAAEDLGDVIRAIGDMSRELFDEFFAVPDLVEPSGRVAPESFDASTRLAFVSVGNALDYAIRLVSDMGRERRIRNLKRDLAEEMRAAGMTGDPGESPT